MSDRKFYPREQQIDFALNALGTHSKVVSVQKLKWGLYEIERTKPLSAVIVFFTDLYTVGQADVIEIMRRYPEVNIICTMSAYNGYTESAVEYGSDNQVGVFKFGELLGALSRTKPWEYVKRDKEGHPVRHYTAESA